MVGTRGFDLVTREDSKRWLRKLLYRVPDRAARRNPSGLVARYGSGPDRKLGRITLISATGLFLVTDERWPIGELISVTLQKQGPPEAIAGFHVDIQARVASIGENGVGLAFILPEALDRKLWELMIDNIDGGDSAAETEHLRFVIGMVRTVLFLHRLCPSETKEAVEMLSKELDESRTKNMLEVALRAEAILAKEPDVDRMRIHPNVATTLLKEGSWANDELTQQLWVGLLANSCTTGEPDDSNLALAEVLVQVTPTQAKILFEGCSEAEKLMSGNGGTLSGDIVIEPPRAIQITGLSDLSRIGTDLAYLFNFGLLEKSFKFTSYLPTEGFNITPSQLGLKLYRQGMGHPRQTGKS